MRGRAGKIILVKLVWIAVEWRHENKTNRTTGRPLGVVPALQAAQGAGAFRVPIGRTRRSWREGEEKGAKSTCARLRGSIERPPCVQLREGKGETMTRPINKTASAFLNINTARSDCYSALHAPCRVHAIVWINNAIAQLESARAKLETKRKAVANDRPN